MESGPELYNDMVLAYNNDAKYIIIFDTNANYTQNVLQQGQLDSMKQFWQYAQANPRTTTSVSDRTAYVLPEDYAYAFGGPSDKIWGLWNSDDLSVDISMSVTTLLHMDSTNLDIVYPSSNLDSAGYKDIIYWNNTSLMATASISPKQDNSLPFYANSIYLYAAVVCIIVAVAITALKFRYRLQEPGIKNA